MSEDKPEAGNPEVASPASASDPPAAASPVSAEASGSESASADAASSESAPEGEAKAAPADADGNADEDDGAVLDASGRERPRFLLAFPQDPDLARLAAAFEAGNYRLVREQAETLAERSEDPAVRRAALELRRRISPDPLAKYLLALTAALLLFLAYFAYHH